MCLQAVKARIEGQGTRAVRGDEIISRAKHTRYLNVRI